MAENPIMLKELLELDSRSESFRWASLKRAAGTTLRCLLDTELGGGGGLSTHVRSQLKSSLMRLSNVIKAVNALQFFTALNGNPAGSLLPKSFSMKLRRGFWKRSGNEKERDLRSLSEEAVETSSLFSPSPVISSCRSSFKGGDSTCSNFLLFSTATSPLKEIPVGFGEGFHPASADNQPKENYGIAMDCPLEEEKEQFSPVSVMEFPYKGNDEEEVEQPSTASSCSQQSLTSIKTTKNQLQRFQSSAELEDPVDLNHQFACTDPHFESTVHVVFEDEEDRRWRKAFSLLHQIAGCEPLRADEDKLLFEFFVEGLSLLGNCRRWRSGSASEEELIRVATGWFSGEMWAVEDGGDVVVGEMERSGGWKRFEEMATDMVAAEMSRGLMTGLMDELVADQQHPQPLPCHMYPEQSCVAGVMGLSWCVIL